MSDGLNFGAYSWGTKDRSRIFVDNTADGKDGSFGTCRWTNHILTNLQCVPISAVSHLQEYFAEWGDRDSVVGIETHNGLDGSGIELELRCRRGISCPLYSSGLSPGHTQPGIRCITGLFAGRKAAGSGTGHLPLSGAEVNA